MVLPTKFNIKYANRSINWPLVTIGFITEIGSIKCGSILNEFRPMREIMTMAVNSVSCLWNYPLDSHKSSLSFLRSSMILPFQIVWPMIYIKHDIF